MKHYNRLHYVICGDVIMDSFSAYLNKVFPLLNQSNVQLLPLSRMTPIELNGEMLLIVYDNTVSMPLQFHFDVYWCVASLKTVRQFVNDVKRNVMKSKFHFLSYPDELTCSFYESVSPFFYWYEIHYHECNVDYLILLISYRFHIINELDERFIGFTDNEMINFAQLDKRERIIRLTKNNHLYGDQCMKCILKQLIDLASSVDELISTVQ